MTVVDPGDMNRVVAATAGTAAAMAPAALVSQAVPVGPAVPAGMSLGPGGPGGHDPGGPGGPDGHRARVDPERLGVPNPVGRVDPGNREATGLSLGRELTGPGANAPAPDSGASGPDAGAPAPGAAVRPMPALLHRRRRTVGGI